MQDFVYVSNMPCKKCKSEDTKLLTLTWDGGTDMAFTFPDFIPLKNAKIAGSYVCHDCAFSEECIVIVKDYLMDTITDVLGEVLLSYTSKSDFKGLLTSALQEFQEMEFEHLNMISTAYSLGSYIILEHPDRMVEITEFLNSRGLSDFPDFFENFKIMMDESELLTNGGITLSEDEILLDPKFKNKKKKCGEGGCGGNCLGDCGDK